MTSIPAPLVGLLLEFAPALPQPTLERACPLLLAALLTTGRRTVANLLRTLGGLAHGDASSWQTATQARPGRDPAFAATVLDLTWIEIRVRVEAHGRPPAAGGPGSDDVPRPGRL